MTYVHLRSENAIDNHEIHAVWGKGYESDEIFRQIVNLQRTFFNLYDRNMHPRRTDHHPHFFTP